MKYCMTVAQLHITAQCRGEESGLLHHGGRKNCMRLIYNENQIYKDNSSPTDTEWCVVRE